MAKKFERKKKVEVEVEAVGTVESVLDLSDIVGDLKKEFKSDDFFDLSDEEAISKLEVQDWLPVPPPLMEIVGGTDGLPCGLVTIFQGRSDSGKTTCAIHALVETQRLGGIAVICLTEPKFSLDRAKKMGLKEGCIIIKVKTVEEGEAKLSKIIGRVRAKYPDKKLTIVWDSLGYAKCEKELESKKHNNMWKASALKTMLGTMQIWIDETATTFIGINHTYKTMKGNNKGGGGEGVKLAAAMVFDFSQLAKVKVEESCYVAIRDFDYTDKDGDVLTFTSGEIVPKHYILGDKSKGHAAMKRADKDLNVQLHKEGRTVGVKSLIKNEKNHVGTPFLQTEVKIDEFGLVWDRKLGEAP